MPAISLGYVNAATGVNDSIVVSPSNRLPGTALRDLVVSAAQATGRAPLWVDGTPAALVTLIATRLGLPIGKPDGWDPLPPPDDPAGALALVADQGASPMLAGAF